MSLNKVMLIGNLGHDPEIRYMPASKRAVTNLSIAMNDSFPIIGQMCGSVVSSWHNPWPDSAKSRGCDSRDPTRNIAHGGRWIDGVRSEVKAPKASQKIKCAAFGHTCVAINHEVFAQSLRISGVT